VTRVRMVVIREGSPSSTIEYVKENARVTRVRMVVIREGIPSSIIGHAWNDAREC